MNNNIDIKGAAPEGSTNSHNEKSPIDVELLEHPASNDAEISKDNALSYHQEVSKTPEEALAERRFVRKIDLLILPLLAILYFLASMDRGDIGNAAVAGMTKDLKLSPHMLSTCVSMFYVGYIIFQLPGNIFLRVITPPIQLSLALFCWGAFTSLLSLSKSYGTVVGLRVCVGVGEAFIQAAPLYLTLWYKRNELASRAAIFFSMSAVAGAFNGIIAYGIEKNIDGAHGLAAWKWIFIIEGRIQLEPSSSSFAYLEFLGAISIGYGFVIFVILPPVPEKVKWGFTTEQKEIAIRRSKEAYNILDAKINPRQLLWLFKDPKIYFYVVLYCCVNASLASFGTFLPIILKTLHFSALNTQLMTIPIYTCAAISTITLGIISDRFKTRGIFLAIAFSIAGVGWLILLVSKSHNLSFAGTFLIGIGTYPCVILIQSWMNSNFVGFTKRGGVLAAINVFGQCFAIASTQIYSDAPHYYRGNGFVLGSMVVGVVTTGLLRWYLAWKNSQKEKNRDSEEAARLRVMDIDHIGDAHPDFVYYL